MSAKDKVLAVYPQAFARTCVSIDKWHIFADRNDTYGLSGPCRELLNEDLAWSDAASRLPTPQPETSQTECDECSAKFQDYELEVEQRDEHISSAGGSNGWSEPVKPQPCTHLHKPLAPPVAPSEDAKRIAELEAEVARLTQAIRWALGFSDPSSPEFEERPANSGAYWWRNKLSELSALKSPSPTKEDAEPKAFRLALNMIAELQVEVDRWKGVAFSPVGDNHHNARLCPYCSPESPSPLSPEKVDLEAKYERALEHLQELHEICGYVETGELLAALGGKR